MDDKEQGALAVDPTRKISLTADRIDAVAERLTGEADALRKCAQRMRDDGIDSAGIDGVLMAGRGLASIGTFVCRTERAVREASQELFPPFGRNTQETPKE